MLGGIGGDDLVSCWNSSAPRLEVVEVLHGRLCASLGRRQSARPIGEVLQLNPILVRHSKICALMYERGTFDSLNGDRVGFARTRRA